MFGLRGREHLWTDNPGNSPAGKSESLGKTVDDQDIVFVDIIDVLSRGYGGPVAVAGVVVATVELIHDQCSSVTADILDLGELRVLDYFPRRIAGVRGQDDRGSSCDLLGDLVGVDVVVVRFGKRGRDSCELYKCQLLSIFQIGVEDTKDLRS